MSAKLRIWAQLPPMPREQLIAAVQRFEAAALEGIWCSQTFGAPFGPLSAAAVASKQLKLGTGIALAFVRSPLETACNIMDLDLLSGGRSVLGLGSSAKSLTEDAFGAPYGKPLRHMREVIKFIRLLIAQAHTGELGVLEGEYHRLDLRQFRTFAPPVRTDIPIYLPAVFEKACEMAGEIGDGLLGHPLWNEHWIAEKTIPALRRGLAKTNRERGAVTLNLQMFVAVNPDRRAAIEDARPSVAYYSQSPQYLPYFDEIGFGAEARALQECFARGDLTGMVAACSDAMVESIAIVGSADEVRRRVLARTREADACTPVIPHYTLTQDKLDYYTAGIAGVFYGGSERLQRDQARF
jgi:probable F420-dependent oxidoreductase